MMSIDTERLRLFLCVFVAFLLVPGIVSAQPVAESAFDSDAEGWTTGENATTLEHFTAGGRPGGYVEAQAENQDQVWFWEAPSAFTGNVSAAYNGAIRFELRQSPEGSEFATNDIVLEGTETRLVFTVDRSPTGRWTPYRVPLRSSAGWRIGSTGEPASENAMRTVLENLQSLRIRGNFWDQGGATGLDNVRLQAAQTIERWVDPTQTYLQPDDTDNPRDAAAINLANLGLAPGDQIRVVQPGEFNFDPTQDDAEQTQMVAVFSGSDVLEGTSQENRVPDAIGIGQDVTTLATDIPEDFLVDGQVIEIPTGATHLFLSPNDGTFEDNTDSDGDFRLRLTLPSPPSGLTADASTEIVRLNWNASAFDTVTEFRIYRSTTPIDSTRGPGKFTPVAGTTAGTTTYDDGGVTTGQTYYYRITAVDGDGNESAFSSETPATPGTRPSPPSNARAAAIGDSSVVVQWDASSATDVQRYRLYRDTESIGDTDRADASLIVDSTTVETTTYEDTGLGPGQTYHYRVTAVDTERNESDFSTEGTARPPLSIFALPDSVRTAQGGTTTIDVLANDLRGTAPLDEASVQIDTDPAHGSTTVSDTGSVVYTHDGTANFEDAFTYVVEDTDGAADTTSVVLSAAEVRLATGRETVPFGRQQVGAPGATTQLDFESVGDTAATGLTLALDNETDYSILNDSGEKRLPPGSARTVQVEFRPDDVGVEQTATLTMTSETGLEWSANLTGAGVGAQVEAATETNGVARRGEAAAVSVTPEGPFEPTSRHLYARTGGGSYQEVDDPSQIPASLVTAKGVDYYVVLQEGEFRVVVPGGTAARARRNPLHLPVQFDGLSSQVSLSPDGYRMVSVPAKTDVKAALRNSYGDYDRSVWRALRWDPTAGENGDYREFPDIDSLRPGQGTWLITREGEGFDVGAGQSVDASDPHKMVLNRGWNQVGTPFAFPVPWDTVQAASGFSDADLDGPVGFEESDGYQRGETVLRPWKAYFVFNATGERDTLVVPPVGTEDEEALRAKAGPEALAETRLWASPRGRPSRSQSGGAGGDSRAERARVDQGTEVAPERGPSPTREREKATGAPYTLRVTARPEGGPADRVWLGLRSSAKESRDELDLAQAPPINQTVQVSALEQVGDRLVPHSGSFKPSGQTGQTWTLLLTHRSDRTGAGGSTKKVRLALEAEGAPPEGQRRYVLDLDEERRLTPGTSIALDPGEQRRLKLIVGTEAFAQKESADISLGQFENELRGNSPNPFGEETTLTYVLGEEAEVTLDVFNVLGQRVRTLVQGRKDAGVHHARWKGENQYGDQVGSGIYFYRIQVGDFSDTRKMVLVR